MVRLASDAELDPHTPAFAALRKHDFKQAEGRQGEYTS